jgi:oxepin-CoA hydrolase/3-oxo-5,6-dehydrosuberyl-CoA semialdehyde dehydrogenase
MDQDKLKFITEEYISLVKNLQPGAMGKWGKMNGQQMVEHVAAFFYVSSGKIKFDLVTPEEHLPKFKEFLLSDKQFRENTRAPLTVIGEETLPLRYATMEEAVENLSGSVADFEAYFKKDPCTKTMHPVFGELNFEEWILLHYKHVTHHLRQFGLI